MNSPKILIVDDEAPARKRLVMLLEDIRQQCPCDLIGEVAHAQAAFDSIAVGKPDILLLDVQMPGMSGLELVQHLVRNQNGPIPAIIFITAYDEYALKAFEVHAMDYLLKPVRASRLAEAIKRVSQLRAQAGAAALVSPAGIRAVSSARQYFSVLEKNRIVLIPVSDVLFIKAEQKYLSLHTKQRIYLLEESLSAIEEEMQATMVRVHRNALVARDAIIAVERVLPSMVALELEHEKMAESWQVILRDTNDCLPISRRQWPVIRALVR
jgi:two-component system response regulator AlgR